MAAIGYSEVTKWRAAPLGDAGDGVKKDLTDLESSQEGVESQAIPDSWTGIARIVAEARRTMLVERLRTHIEGKQKVQRGLYDAETAVTEIERLVTDVEDQARSDQFSISTDGTVTDTSTPPTFDNRYEAEEWSDGRTAKAQQIADDITAILGKAAAADAALAGSIPSGHVEFIDDYGTVDPEVAERWAQLSESERRAIIEQMIEDLAEESGVENPTIEWMDPSWGPWGQWTNSDPPTIRIREDLLDDPHIFNTVAHEVRHGRQFEAIDDNNDWQFPWEDDPFDEHREDGITEEQAEDWEENFEDYQSTDNGDTYEEYFDQPVERDAREAGKDYLEDLTEEELERLLEESR